jgi:hypothetical protein
MTRREASKLIGGTTGSLLFSLQVSRGQTKANHRQMLTRTIPSSVEKLPAIGLGTINIPNIGSPPDDPTCMLPGVLFLPSTPQPWHCVVGTVAGEFRFSYNLHPIYPAFNDLAADGFLCLVHYVRLTVPIPTQTTSGKWPQQTNDLKMGIRALRINPFMLGYQVTGKVYGLSGSGGASHVLYCAIDGMRGLDKLDGAICLSPPTDFSDRQSDVTTKFIDAVTDYGDTTDLSTLRARSPIALNLRAASPILHYNGDHEEMPLSQWTLFKTAMAASGASGYNPIKNTGDAGQQHSFAMWPYVKTYARQWLRSISR